MSTSTEILISIVEMPISVETSGPQTPVVSQAGASPVEGPPALAGAARVVREADQLQPPSNVDLRAEARVVLPETFRAAAHVARVVAAPVTSAIAERAEALQPAAVAHVEAHLAEARLAVVLHAAAVVVVAAVTVVAVTVVAVTVAAVTVAAVAKDKYII